MEIKAHFVSAGKRAEDLVRWKTVSSEIRDETGRAVFAMPEVEVPEGFSQTAVDVLASRYLRKAGVPTKKGARGPSGTETSFKQMVERVVVALEREGLTQKIFASKKQARQFGEEVRYLLYTQSAAFNSPVWFNAGLYEAYGIKGGEGLYAYDRKTKKITQTKSSYQRPQCSACFIQSVQDDLDAIFDLARVEAKLFKFGSGSGSNFSNWRSKYESLQSGGKSSGLIAFLEVLDRGAGAIRSGGTTRRAAKMVCVDIDHPEIEEFIDWKVHEEKKAIALVKAGFSSGLDGEAYRTVGGQNANNSVRISDKFMQALKQKKNWSLLSRTEGKELRTVPATELWRQIAQSAWECGDPGLQFDSTIQRWHTCPEYDRIRASNPCSEYMFVDDTACNLASINLTRFLSPMGEFLWQDFAHTVKTLICAQEILVEYAGYPTAKIAERSQMFRTLGLGFANLGGFLIQKGIAYDSEDGRSWAQAISAYMTAVAYETSAELAKKRGPFKEFKRNRAPMLRVIGLHKKAAKEISFEKLGENARKRVLGAWESALKLGKKYGFRNAQVTVIAPTGTIGLLMDCDTFGIEPEFALLRVKHLVGGGKIQTTHRSLEKALLSLGYKKNEILELMQELQNTGGFKSMRPEHRAIFLTAQPDSSGACISPLGHLRMVAAVQPFVSGAISKTINLPSSALVEDVSSIYEQAHAMGLKAVSIYRDRSKAFQPLQQVESSRCPECGQNLVRTGNCLSCAGCGYSMACG